jgi:hypothetical protein
VKSPRPGSRRWTPAGIEKRGRAANAAGARLDERGRGAVVTGGSEGAGVGTGLRGGTLATAGACDPIGLGGGAVLFDSITLLTGG